MINHFGTGYNGRLVCICCLFVCLFVVCLFVSLFIVSIYRSVVFEAISFHKQSSDLLQSARTEKRIAEKERKDAEQNSENLSKLIAKLQQTT